MEIFENYEFEGHLPLDAEIPDAPGIFMVCTRTSGMGGVKILGAYESEKMLSSLRSSPKRDCWKKHAETDLTVCYLEMPAGKERSDLIFRLVNRRWYVLDCVDPPMDDF